MNDTNAITGRFSQSGVAQASEAPDRSPTAVDNVKETFELAFRLCERVNILVDRIAGNAPPETTTKGEGISPVANGILDDLRDKSIRTDRSIRSALSALDRLESQI